MIYHNGYGVARSQLNEVNGIANRNHLSPLSVQTLLALKAGDEVWVRSNNINGGFLFDITIEPSTHFNGLLLEEEIDVASL